MAKASRGRLKREEGITLIELIVAMAIMGVLSTMLVVSWFSLQSAYSFTVSSDNARAIARDALAQMRASIRNAQQQGSGQPLFGQPMIVRASSTQIRFTTPLEVANGSDLLTRYWYVGASGRTPSNSAPNNVHNAIYYQRDTNDNGVFDSADPVTLVAQNIVNSIMPSASSPTPLFQYTYIDANGNSQTATGVTDPGNLNRMTMIQIRIIADLDPARAPVYMDLMSTVEPRNLQQF